MIWKRFQQRIFDSGFQFPTSIISNPISTGDLYLAHQMGCSSYTEYVHKYGIHGDENGGLQVTKNIVDGADRAASTVETDAHALPDLNCQN